MRTKNRSITHPQTDPIISSATLTFPCTVFVEREGQITRQLLHGETSKSWIAGWGPGYREKLPKNQYRLLNPEETAQRTWIWDNGAKLAAAFDASRCKLTYEQLRQIADIIGYEGKPDDRGGGV